MLCHAFSKMEISMQGDTFTLRLVIQPRFSKRSSYVAKNSLMETQKSIEGIAVSCNNMVCFVLALVWM